MKDSRKNLVKWKQKKEETIAKSLQKFLDIFQINEDGRLSTTDHFEYIKYLKIISHNIEFPDIGPLKIKQKLIRDAVVLLKKSSDQNLNHFHQILCSSASW